MGNIPLLVLLQLVCLWGGGTADTVRHVNWNTGHDNSTCWEGSIPCATLAYALEDLDSDTTVLLDDEEVSHFNNTTVQGPINNITINSSHGNTIIDCSEEGGFAFINVAGLAISNVKLHNCGALQNSTSYNANGDPIVYTVSLYLYNCTDVSLLSTNVSYSPGAGVVMLAVTGHVEIFDSSFIDNGRRISRENGYEFTETFETARLAGGGLLIELPSCPLGVSSENCSNSGYGCDDFQPNELLQYKNVTYEIVNSRFINNTAETPNFDTPSFLNNPQVNHFTAIGRGGGMSMFIKGRTENVHVVVSNSTFDNNWALYGGGLFMEIWHHPVKVSLEVVDSSFTRNELPYNSEANTGTGGGGLRYNEAYCDGSRTTLLMNGCTFDSNKAFWGGGSSMVLQPDNNSIEDHIALINCTYMNNTARIGAAADVHGRFGRPTVVLENMAFRQNNNTYAESDIAGYISGEGIVYLYLVSVVVKSSLMFESNEGNGISSFASAIQFLHNSTSRFYDNHAFRGAALALYGNAAIILHNGSQLNFTKNRADTVGGAIYHAAPGNRALFDNGACPLQMADGLNWSNTDLWFINNTAAQGGRGMSIYTYSIYPCAQRGETELNETLYFSSFHYECDNQSNPNCCANQVSGDGSIIVPNNKLFLRAFPGEMATLPFNVTDGQSKGVRVLFEGIITGNDSHLAYSVDVLNGSSVLVTGLPSTEKRLELHSTESQTLQVQIDLEITQCPPGYLLTDVSDDRKECHCKINSSYPGLSCDAHLFHTTVKPNFWIGYKDIAGEFGFQSAQCPSGFCHARSLTLEGSDHYNLTSLDEKVCGPQNRTGVLCGKCKEGYGISILYSKKFQCVPCNDLAPWKRLEVVVIWLLTEFVPFNIVFLLFIVFNVNILSGWGGVLYTFVFFCQVVTKSPVFQYVNTDPESFMFFLSASEFLAGVWNLNFFSYFVPPEQSCYSTDSLVRGVIIGNYFTLLLWPLLLYILLAASHSCYRHGYCCGPVHRCLFKLGKAVAKCQHSEGKQSEEESSGVNSLAGLCSFFVLAYTRLVILTWEIFVQAAVSSSDGERRSVFFYDGNVPWFDRTHHAPYVVPILLCSIGSVLIPTLLLVSFPFVPKLLVKLHLDERRPFCWIISLLSSSYLKFLFDIFQGCFKPNTRYFAALYLIYRHLFVMAWALADYEGASFWQLILCVLFAFLHSVVQPFESSKVNKLSSCLFALLILIIFIGDGNFYTHQLGNMDIWRNVTRATTIIPHVVAVVFFIWCAVCLIRQRCRKNVTSDREISTELPTIHGNTEFDREQNLFDRQPERETKPPKEREGDGFTETDLTASLLANQ